MKTAFDPYIRWSSSRATSVAAAAAGGVLGLSLALIPFNNMSWAAIVIRDVVQILAAGMHFPLVYMRRSREGWSPFGFTTLRGATFLLINFGLAPLLLFLFVSESPPPPDFQFDRTAVWEAVYVFVTLSFDLVFFYAFLRTVLERAFGIIPAMVLTALVYSFHHAVVPPKFEKLTVVGVIYTTTYSSSRRWWSRLLTPGFAPSSLRR
jgi:membrane protease YdiL (CAAX protease family)